MDTRFLVDLVHLALGPSALGLGALNRLETSCSCFIYYFLCVLYSLPGFSCHEVTIHTCTHTYIHSGPVAATSISIITLRHTCAARGQMIALGLIYLKLKKHSLSEVHFNTGRLLFKFNGLQYRFAAGQVFVAFAYPVSVSFG